MVAVARSHDDIGQVRGDLGISPSAYADALDALGQDNAAVVIGRLNSKRRLGTQHSMLLDKTEHVVKRSKCGGRKLEIFPQLDTNGKVPARRQYANLHRCGGGLFPLGRNAPSSSHENLTQPPAN
jgi:hypothetical protein